MVTSDQTHKNIGVTTICSLAQRQWDHVPNYKEKH